MLQVKDWLREKPLENTHLCDVFLCCKAGAVF